MVRTFTLLCAMLYSAISFATPRVYIDQLLPIEQCVYQAKLGAAGALLRIQKHATDCGNIKIFWHGNETEYEIAFIKEYTCEGFQMNKDPIKTGDIMYEACIKRLP